MFSVIVFRRHIVFRLALVIIFVQVIVISICWGTAFVLKSSSCKKCLRRVIEIRFSFVVPSCDRCPESVCVSEVLPQAPVCDRRRNSVCHLFSDCVMDVYRLHPVGYQELLARCYSMEQSPSWEANRFAASQEIPCILRNPKDHYRIHKYLGS